MFHGLHGCAPIWKCVLEGAYGSFPEGNKTLQHSTSVFRHIHPLVGKQKKKDG